MPSFSLLAIAAAVTIGLLAREFWGWLPAISRTVIRVHARLLPHEQRHARRQAWFEQLASQYDDRRLTGLVWAAKLAVVSVRESKVAGLRSLIARVRPARVAFVAACATLAALSWTPPIADAVSVLLAAFPRATRPRALTTWARSAFRGPLPRLPRGGPSDGGRERRSAGLAGRVDEQPDSAPTTAAESPPRRS